VFIIAIIIYPLKWFYQEKNDYSDKEKMITAIEKRRLQRFRTTDYTDAEAAMIPMMSEYGKYLAAMRYEYWTGSWQNSTTVIMTSASMIN
jgi:hypothetical protein